MPIIKLGPNAIRKTVSGGGNNFVLPSELLTTTYGPGWPINPMSPPRDSEMPRTIDYPISANATLTPRTQYGLMSFPELFEAYSNVAEVSTPVSLISRELTTFTPKWVDDEDNEIPDFDLDWLLQKPDKKTPWTVWLTRLMQSTKIYDAPAVYIDKSNGNLNGLRVIDGSTLFVIVDEYGDIPEPEKVSDYIKRRDYAEKTFTAPPSSYFGKDYSIEGTPTNLSEFVALMEQRRKRGLAVPSKIPAFTQIIKGTPFSWWSKDQIWYQPQNPSIGNPYGQPFIEKAWGWIMIIVNITSFQLGFYRQGTVPEGYLVLPRDFYPKADSILLAEQMMNARMTSNPATERNRIRAVPEGTQYIATKGHDFPNELYTTAWKNVLHAIGIPPSEFGDVPGQGLGGKGFKEGATSDLSRNTLNPHREFIMSMVNDIANQMGVNTKETHFELAYPTEEIDPEKMKQSAYDGMAHGVYTMNDVLGQLGLDPVSGSMDSNGNADPNHVANKHMIVAGQSIYVVEDMKISETGVATPTFSSKPADGAPVDPETAAEQQGAVHTKQDNQTITQILANMEALGKLGTTTYSFPTYGKTKLDKADITGHDGAMVALFMPDDVADKLRNIAEEIGLPDDAEMELASNMHLTLAFLPDAEKAISDESLILSVVQSVALRYKAIAGNIQGYGVFNGEDGKHVLFAMLDCPELPAIREEIVKGLETKGVAYGKDHGFVPHITLAYFTDNWQVPEGFMVPDMPVEIDAIALAIGEQVVSITFDDGYTKVGSTNTSQIRIGIAEETKEHGQNFTPSQIETIVADHLKENPNYYNTEKLLKYTVSKGLANEFKGTLDKHCGVCPEDDAYFGAPISREVEISFMPGQHANGVEIVAMIPNGLLPKPALWKPEGDEKTGLQQMIGGKQFPREEAAYLFDRSLGFHLVPLAYVSVTDDGEHGAVVYYTFGMVQNPRKPEEYADYWTVRAAVFDYITSQQDRGFHHNYGTHPDDVERMILFDNGLSFPTASSRYCVSPFCDMWANKPLPEDVLIAIKVLLKDEATWNDALGLVGELAIAKARYCAERLIAEGMITTYVDTNVTATSYPQANESETK